MFYELTDENHAMDTFEIIDYLAEHGVPANTKINNLSGDEGRQLTIDDYLEDPDAEGQSVIDEKLGELQERYGLDFAGHIEDICHGNVLHRTIEYMRKHYPGKA